jgi:hypothetical protein
MRTHLSALIGIFLFAGLACSHAEKKAEPSASNAATAVIAPAPAATKDQGFVAPKKIVCAVNGDSRILEVQNKGQGCEFHYTKGEKDGVVASSRNGGITYCERSLEKLRDRLKGSGFECK